MSASRSAGSHEFNAAEQWRAYSLMLGSTAFFSCMSACSHGLASLCDWRITAVSRAGIAFLLTALLARLNGVTLIFRWPRTLWMRSIVGSISMLFTFYALAHLPIAMAVTLFNTFPLWVTLLAWPVLGDRPTASFLIALVSGVLGVCFIEFGVRPEQVTSVLVSAEQIRIAIGTALLAAFCTAVVMLGLHRLRHLDSLAIVVHFSGFATVACLLYTVISAYTIAPVDFRPITTWPVILLLLGVGMFATLGQITMTRAFGLGSPQKLAIVGLTQVLFALGFDIFLWYYRLESMGALGILLILAPVAWLVSRPRS